MASVPDSDTEFRTSLEEMLPQYEHMNFSMIGTDISPAAADTILRHVKTFDLDKVCFLMNLNDVLPDPVPDRVTTPRPGMGKGVAILRVLRSRLDWLRGRSYLYTHLRSVASNYYAREGFESHGQIGYEFYPHQYKHVIAQTAARINALSDALGELGCELVVVMLPYEMQISQAAATTYAALGVRWESDFVYGSTQQLISACLRGVTSLNAYGAFIPLAAGGGEVDAWRQRNDVGEYFVYNRGDRLDWNHLNRQGHRRVAEFIYRQHVLDTGSPASLPLPAASGTPGGRPWPQSATHAASSERVAR